MTWSRKLRTNEDRGDYAAVEDFRGLFTEEADNFYLLALLLTGDEAQAEQTLLDCSSVDVHEARIRALQQVAAERTSLLTMHGPQELISTVIEDINEKTN